MSHEPGRERHMTYRCERCGQADPPDCLHYIKSADEYWCGTCIDEDYNKEHADDE